MAGKAGIQDSQTVRCSLEREGHESVFEAHVCLCVFLCSAFLGSSRLLGVGVA